ncbi:MAG TPA: methyltransferase domain-containing protein [Thermoanaerobaculia bacterium]|nr:methyltransferase domain-containing protein [Thermoanaerobaculia bacterium]
MKRWKLRRLQERYYRGDASAIPEYLATLAQARKRPAGRAVHLGAGGHHLDGWINVDVLPDGADLLADFVHALPFRSESVDFLHSEDLLEHLDLGVGKELLRECHRVLKPGGVMRLLTPDLRALIQRVYIDRDARHLAWCNDTLAADGACEALNMHLRMNGEHRFVYDEEQLTRVLRATGFRVRRVRWNQSRVPELRWLDLRDFGLSLFLEAVKPVSS